MSIASISAVTEAEVASLRASHAGVFPGTGALLRRWGPLALAVIYLIWSMWFFEFGKLFESSDRVLRLLRNFVVWRDMGTWAYSQIYVGIAQRAWRRWWTSSSP